MEKFEYILKKDPIQLDNGNFIFNYLKQLGIKKPLSFINGPSKVDEESPILLDNIDKMVEELKYGFDNDKSFFVQVDADADGITSAAIFYNYFKKLYPEAKINYRVHEGKEHGVIVETVPEEFDYVVIPDAGTNQIKEQIQLISRGQKVLVLDHHEPDDFKEIENVVVVNNQLSKSFKNKSLSGAGVVYKAIQYFSKLYSDNQDYQEYTDLAALGIISDMMDTRQLDNNYLIHYGLNNINNPMFKALLSEQSYSVSSSTNPNKIDIAFYITPLINAVIRAGSYEENEMMFEGFITSGKEDVMVEREWRGKTYTQNYYENIARICSNIRGQQNRKKEKAKEFLDLKLQKDFGIDNSIILAITSREDEITVPKTMTGLVAMELMKKYKKPTLVLRPKKTEGVMHLYGSGRGTSTVGFNSFKDVLNESPYTVFAQGHGMAFGFGVRKDELENFMKDMNERLSGIDFGNDILEVDAIFTNKNIREDVLIDFGESIHLYGNSIPQPKFAFKLNLTPSNFSVIGKKKNVVKIEYKGIEFIKFNCGDLAEQLEEGIGDLVEIEIVGRAQINEFRGSRTTQVIMDNFKMKEQDCNVLI